MRLATVRIGGATHAARLDGDRLVVLTAPDVGALLAAADRDRALGDEEGTTVAADDPEFATLLPRPEKFLCVGMNYREHIRELGREVPEYPTLFAKFPTALIGAHDPIVLPAVSECADWEAELGIVIGATIRHASPKEALGAIAGYTVVNDISIRDWQRRTTEWLQGKTFDQTTPVGPYLVSLDEIDDPFDLGVRCAVDGKVVQEDRTASLVFGPLDIVAYCSQIVTLNPGDIISTGTPGGVGEGRTPPVYLLPGQTVTTTVDGVGECVNRTVPENPASA
jgi:acylpyruvate hydrolase